MGPEIPRAPLERPKGPAQGAAGPAPAPFAPFPWLSIPADAGPTRNRRPWRRVSPFQTALVLAADEAGLSRRLAARLAQLSLGSASTIARHRPAVAFDLLERARGVVQAIRLHALMAKLADLDLELGAP